MTKACLREPWQFHLTNLAARHRFPGEFVACFNSSNSYPGRGVTKISGWLRATVDNKPWWAIVLAAFLASLGSEGVKNIPNLVSFVSSFFPSDRTVFVALKKNGAGPPLDGPEISIMDGRSQHFLPIEGTDRTSVTMKSGMAALTVRLKPGPGYLIFLSYTDGGKTLRYSEPIEIRSDLQHVLQFDEKNWPPSDVALSERTALAPASAIEASAELPPWMKFAYGEIGQREIPGSQHNPRILEYFQATGATDTPKDDETDWSSAFIHWVLKQTNISGTHSLSNRSWMTWGSAVQLRPGCIAVFWRITPQDIAAHAGFVVDVRDDGNIAVLGGNQSDQVKIILLHKSRLLGCRWPT